MAQHFGRDSRERLSPVGEVNYIKDIVLKLKEGKNEL
jgi:hypothetical protein